MYLKSFTVGANNVCIHQCPKNFIGLLDSCNHLLINIRLTCERPFSCTDDENSPVGKGRVFSNSQKKIYSNNKGFSNTSMDLIVKTF